MAAYNWLSVSRCGPHVCGGVGWGWVGVKVELALVQHIWESVPEKMLIRTETGSLLHAMILEVKMDIQEVVRDHFYCRIMKIVRLRVVAGHSTKYCPLIKVWELNQTTRHSYLPIQQLFDSSVGEAAGCSGELCGFHYLKWLLGKEKNSIWAKAKCQMFM